MSKWKIEVDEAAVRNLLGEHAAMFPEIRVIQEPGYRDWLLGRFRWAWADNTYSAAVIELVDKPRRTAWGMRKTVIHELRHWWEGAASTERMRLVFQSYRRRVIAFWSLCGLGPILALLAPQGHGAQHFVCSLLVAFVFALVSCLASGILADGNPVAETDAVWFALTRSLDPRWRRAVRVSRIKSKAAQGDK